MNLVCVLGLCLTLGGKAPPASALPPLVQYDAAYKAKLEAERPTVRACCPYTNKAMYDYGKLRNMIQAAQRRRG